MAVNVLFVENEYPSHSQVFKTLSDSKFIEFTIVNDMASVASVLQEFNFTHIVCDNICSEKAVFLLDSLNVEIPVLIVCDHLQGSNLTKVNYSIIQKPLTYKVLFDFIAQKTIISDNTLEKYAMGDQDFITQMKQLIIEEFEDNLEKIPSYLVAENFEAVKSNMHQLIGKFAMLEMEVAHELSKSIDNNILKNSLREIPHVHHVLFDVEIALSQLKCSA